MSMRGRHCPSGACQPVLMSASPSGVSATSRIACPCFLHGQQASLLPETSDRVQFLKTVERVAAGGWPHHQPPALVLRQSACKTKHPRARTFFLPRIMASASGCCSVIALRFGCENNAWTCGYSTVNPTDTPVLILAGSTSGGELTQSGGGRGQGGGRDGKRDRVRTITP